MKRCQTGLALLLCGTHGFAFLMSPSLLLFRKLGEKKGWIQALLLSFLPLPLPLQEFMAVCVTLLDRHLDLTTGGQEASLILALVY